MVYEWQGFQDFNSLTGSGGGAGWSGNSGFSSGLRENWTLVRMTVQVTAMLQMTHSLPWQPPTVCNFGVYQAHHVLSSGDWPTIYDYAQDWVWFEQIPMKISWTEQDILTPVSHWQGWLSIDSKAQRRLEVDAATVVFAYGFPDPFGAPGWDVFTTCWTARALYKSPA